MIEEHATKSAVKTFKPTKVFRPMPRCSHAESTLRLSLVLASMGNHVLLLCANQRKARMDEARHPERKTTMMVHTKVEHAMLRDIAIEGMYRDAYRIEREELKLKVWMAA